MEKLVITPEEIERAEQLRKSEAVEDLTEEGIFKKGLFGILVGAEKYPRALGLYQRLEVLGLTTPQQVLSSQERLAQVLAGTNWPEVKWKRMVGFCCWWLEEQGKIAQEILTDVSNGRSEAFGLRNKLKKADGIGLKTASLVLTSCGYEEVVPLDLWMIRFLKRGGYPIQIPDYEKIGAISSLKKYLEAEGWIKEIVKSYNSVHPEQQLTPAGFHRVIWIKSTGWGLQPKLL